MSTSRKWNASLWTAQALLALLFLFAGLFKLVTPASELAKQIQLPVAFVQFIGICETLGALGLLLPGLTRIHTELTAVAAAGLVIIMIGAVVVTLVTTPGAGALLPFVVGCSGGDSRSVGTVADLALGIDRIQESCGILRLAPRAQVAHRHCNIGTATALTRMNAETVAEIHGYIGTARSIRENPQDLRVIRVNHFAFFGRGAIAGRAASRRPPTLPAPLAILPPVTIRRR